MIAATTCASDSSVSRNSPTLAPRGPDSTRPSGNWISTDERGAIIVIFSVIVLLSNFVEGQPSNRLLTLRQGNTLFTGVGTLNFCPAFTTAPCKYSTSLLPRPECKSIWKEGILAPRPAPAPRPGKSLENHNGNLVANARALTGVPGRSTTSNPCASITDRHSRSIS